MEKQEISNKVYAAMMAAEKKMNEQVARFLDKHKNLCVEYHDYEPSLEDFLSNLGEEVRKELVDVDYIFYKWDNERLHTDSIQLATSAAASRKVVRDYEILDAEEYNSTVYANCGVQAEYDGYVLVVAVDEYVVDHDESFVGTPLQCMESIAEQTGKYLISNLYGKSRSFYVDVEEDEDEE